MTLGEFRQALVKALNLHFPQTKVTIATSRGIILTGKAEILKLLAITRSD